MNIRILELIEGAKKAQGLTVIIDVFRAFSLECYLFEKGARKIYPIGKIEDAFAMKAAISAIPRPRSGILMFPAKQSSTRPAPARRES